MRKTCFFCGSSLRCLPSLTKRREQNYRRCVESSDVALLKVPRSNLKVKPQGLTCERGACAHTVCLSVCLSVCLFVCLSLSVCLSVPQTHTHTHTRSTTIAPKPEFPKCCRHEETVVAEFSDEMHSEEWRSEAPRNSEPPPTYREPRPAVRT